MNRSDEISRNLSIVREQIEKAAVAAERNPTNVKLIVVTKNFPVSDVRALYDLGVREFGENRDQEGALKSAQLPEDVNWHFQGQIQSRKIRSISNWAAVVHSLDSLDHARKFDAMGDAGTRSEAKVKDFFVQINLEPDREDRGGVNPIDIENFLHILFSETQIAPIGLMTVAPQNMSPVGAFSQLQELRADFVGRYPSLTQLSMGMSGDFEAAISCGATHIRVGSSILGSRQLTA